MLLVKMKKETIDDVFDIPHADALNIMRIEDVKQFLIKQRVA